MGIYIPFEDYSALLFKGNGTGLSLSLVAAANVIPKQDFSFSMVPSIVYFAGVLAAFVVHFIALSINSDIEARKRRKMAMDGIVEVQSSPHFTPDLQTLVDRTLEQIEGVDRRLLKPEATAAMQSISALCYLISVVCFAAATAIAIAILAAA
ncbi:hypothetical protein [Oricola sp.]|uniref:hypothetical protein n=1 Tax=Oricola sp. TaxID=1979950 RepID=UPI0025EDA93C|nr:hypothetical protein [Oricola sp.]MCI5075799.1 hypothetical protein [Oricola sp.]